LLRPGGAQEIQPFGKAVAALVKRHRESVVLALIVAPAGREHRPTITQQIEERELLSYSQRVVTRQEYRGGRQLNPLGVRRQVSQKHRWSRQAAEQTEMVLRYPGRVIAEFLGGPALFHDFAQELVRVTPGRAIGGRVVGQGEIAKFHASPSCTRPIAELASVDKGAGAGGWVSVKRKTKGDQDEMQSAGVSFPIPNP